MAAVNKSKKPSSKGATKQGPKRSSKQSSKQSSKGATPKKPAVQSKEQKSKPGSANGIKKKKRRIYSEKELDIPSLNMITPAGVKKPKGKKKGKVFVDDQESMMTILAMVNADKEGQIESKMMKARQMEAIRQARQNQLDVMQEQRRTKLEDTKNSLRRRRKGKTDADEPANSSQGLDSSSPKAKSSKKRVSFE